MARPEAFTPGPPCGTTLPMLRRLSSPSGSRAVLGRRKSRGRGVATGGGMRPGERSERRTPLVIIDRAETVIDRLCRGVKWDGLCEEGQGAGQRFGLPGCGRPLHEGVGTGHRGERGGAPRCHAGAGRWRLGGHPCHGASTPPAAPRPRSRGTGRRDAISYGRCRRWSRWACGKA
jgi:hypothetical protein